MALQEKHSNDDRKLQSAIAPGELLGAVESLETFPALSAALRAARALASQGVCATQRIFKNALWRQQRGKPNRNPPSPPTGFATPPGIVESRAKARATLAEKEAARDEVSEWIRTKRNPRPQTPFPIAIFSTT